MPNDIDTDLKTVGEPRVMKRSDSVNSPSHYQAAGVECSDVIKALGLNFNVGNVLKYVWRCTKKDAYVEDLKKARRYLDMEISEKEGGQ